MAPNDIAKLLDRYPFQPLRIHMSNGDSYEILKPWHAGMAMTTMYIGQDPDDSGVPKRSIHADIRHVTHIEPLPNGPPSRGNGQSK